LGCDGSLTVTSYQKVEKIYSALPLSKNLAFMKSKKEQKGGSLNLNFA
jgi:hypothetical protein